MAFKPFSRPCDVCGKPFLVKYAHRSDARFCSRKCAGEANVAVRWAQFREVIDQRANEAKMAAMGRTNDDRWRALLKGRTFESVKVKRSVMFIERLPDQAREIDS